MDSPMSTPPITHVATTDISAMLEPGIERRMDLPGFDAQFVDFPHYIIAITEAIWHDRQVERCLDWYGPDCIIHTMAGPVVGAQAVVDNTWATLTIFPDRRLDGDNVIWSDDGGGAFHSSHLIMSKMTHKGDGDFGLATGRQVLVRTIADCLCRDNRIIEEWLVRDNLALVSQLGLDPEEFARSQAAQDKAAGRDLSRLLGPLRGPQTAPEPGETLTEAANLACALLDARWGSTLGLDTVALCDFRLNAWVPGGLFLYGPDQMDCWLKAVRSCFSDIFLRIDHVSEIPYLGAARDVAVRWCVTAKHTFTGRYGEPTGADVVILAVSHFRIMNGRAREEVTIWDDIALRRQIEGTPVSRRTARPNAAHWMPEDIVDAHHHLWDLSACTYPWLMAKGQMRFFGDPTPIQKNYQVSDFQADFGTLPVTASVHIQVGVHPDDSIQETRWLQAQGNMHGLPSAIVAFCDLTAPDREAMLDAHMACPGLRGVRQILGRSDVEDRVTNTGALIDQPAFLDGLKSLAQRGLSFDLQLVPHQMQSVSRVLEGVPDLKVALCHAGSLNQFDEAAIQTWSSGMQALARLPNVICKVSGFGMFDHHWSSDSIRDQIRQTIDVFRPERIAFGSNFPVDGLHASYQEVVAGFASAIESFTLEERQAMFATNSRQFYRLV
jgi:predicted TIM-barrel fold metal-dependent hydrolase